MRKLLERLFDDVAVVFIILGGSCLIKSIWDPRHVIQKASIMIVGLLMLFFSLKRRKMKKESIIIMFGKLAIVGHCILFCSIGQTVIQRHMDDVLHGGPYIIFGFILLIIGIMGIMEFIELNRKKITKHKP